MARPEQMTSMRAREINAAMERGERGVPAEYLRAKEEGRCQLRERGEGKLKRGLKTMLGLGLVGLKNRGNVARTGLEKAANTSDEKN